MPPDSEPSCQGASVLRYVSAIIFGCLAGAGYYASFAAEPQVSSSAEQPSVQIEYEVGQTGARLDDGLATHHFEITTVSPKAQAWFNQGLILTYGFNHGEAIRAFQEAAALDPNAAMAWWGIAYANGMHINIPKMEESQWRDSHAAAQRALAELDNESDLEKALIRAVAKRTAWPVPPEQTTYDQAYGRAMERLYAKFGQHPDVAVLYVEAMMNLQPWDYWTSELKPKGQTAEFVKALERTLAAHPTHPQAAHLYIHAMEAGPNPAKAEKAADMLRKHAPAAGHLVHMPSHLYARIGRYADATRSNEAAVAADDAYFNVGTEPGKYYLYHAHNLHFLAFAAMMEARYEPAIAAARRLETAVPDPVLDKLAFVVEGVIPTTRHVQIRFGKWQDILKEKAPPKTRPMMLAIHHYSRGIALAALGHVDEARREIELFESQTERVPEDWWVFSNKAHDVLPIGRLMLEGELAYREGRLDDAWDALTRAMDHEDALLYDEPPGWMIPVRHAMGALLMEDGQYRRAERLYREDQQDHPGNGWSLLGLQQSLRAQGRHDEADAIALRLDLAWPQVTTRPTSSCMCAPNVN